MKPFRFQEFDLYQQNSLLKAGTDSMLLGAFTDAPCGTEQVLDIGTGTGILALICAQKYLHAQVTAIEPDEGSCSDAERNFRISKWNGRLHLQQTDLQSFVPKCKFDLIISNPPYYENGLFDPSDQRSSAKHAAYLPLPFLFDRVRELIDSRGRFEVILPTAGSMQALTLAEKNELFLVGDISLLSKAGKEPVRKILHFSPEQKETSRQQLVIRGEDDQYTEEYLLRTKHLHRFT